MTEKASFPIQLSNSQDNFRCANLRYANFRYKSAISRRDAPELCMNLSPRKTEGVGNAGYPLHPQPRVQCVGSTRV
jgi:hypothetical protein